MFLSPISFCIQDFRSISDSGECELAGDNITVLAGQNEAGKTAILLALRDFDLDEGLEPLTKDYLPEGKDEPEPKVSVQFRVDNLEAIIRGLAEEETAKNLPSQFIEFLREKKTLWVTRNLVSGRYSLDATLASFWDNANEESEKKTETLSQQKEEVAVENDEPKEEQEPESTLPTTINFENVGGELRVYWPLFLYFSSFEDGLPREIHLESLFPQPKKKVAPATNQPSTTVAPSSLSVEEATVQPSTPVATNQSVPQATASTQKTRANVPESVLDFIALSGMELEKLRNYSAQDKQIGNYLQHCCANITGDFLTYWQQRIDGRETVQLTVRHHRDSEGESKLAFYVRDTVDQYPEQRSKGFLWFLSFYLRLAGAEVRQGRTDRILLIDEPGSYLHAKAQRDVLKLFEDKIAKSQKIIYSTHNSPLLPSTKLHRLRLVIKKKDKGTLIVSRLTHPDLSEGAFSETLSPIIDAIGIDFRDAFSAIKTKNLLVEGITDRIYLQAWAAKLMPNLFEDCNITPGTGAISLITLASIFIGWGVSFQVLLDHDDQGESVKKRLKEELLVEEKNIIQPRDAVGIEDVFSKRDFQRFIAEIDSSLEIKEEERPTTTIKRLKLDKVLLAMAFSEKYGSSKVILSQDSISRIQTLLDTLMPKTESAKPKQRKKK